MFRTQFTYLLTALALAATACGGDEANNDTPECPNGSSYNPILAQCVEDVRDDNNANNPNNAEDMARPDMAVPSPDMGAADIDEGPDLLCQTDDDGDGAIAMACGGDDCDDNDSRRQPGGTELCDEVDNDCNEQVNEGIDCSVLAHSSSRLYRVDFFAGTYEDLGATIDNLWDIDTHPDGTLYGIAGNRLYTFDEANGQWTPKPGTLNVVADPNGFCIDNEGKAFMTEVFTLHDVDLTTGNSTAIGSMNPAVSSGDCVVNKGNQLFLTSNHTGAVDSFARINGDNGASTIVGSTSYDGIWGLTAAYSRVFGLTSEGNVIEIDVATGETTLLVSFPELSFYGAASTPLR